MRIIVADPLCELLRVSRTRRRRHCKRVVVGRPQPHRHTTSRGVQHKGRLHGVLRVLGPRSSTDTEGLNVVDVIGVVFGAVCGLLAIIAGVFGLRWQRKRQHKDEERRRAEQEEFEMKEDERRMEKERKREAAQKAKLRKLDSISSKVGSGASTPTKVNSHRGRHETPDLEGKWKIAFSDLSFNKKLAEGNFGEVWRGTSTASEKILEKETVRGQLLFLASLTKSNTS
jgi:hypothetical protein